MNTPIYLVIIALCVSICACRTGGPGSWDPNDPTTVILVRHAEQRTGDNPGLSPEGRLRAQQLAVTLQRVDLHAIYSTDTRRTQQTAEPIADDKRLRVERFDRDRVDRLIDDIRRRHRGGTVLVVSHADTLAELAALLDPGVNYDPLPASVFNNLYIVTDAGTNRAEVLVLQYGG